MSNRPVAMANLIVARTASIFGVHFSGSDGAFSPKWKERLPLLVSVCASICVRYESHLVHRKRKCLTVSLVWPHSHWSDSTAPIWWRYPLSRAIPVRSCDNTLASLRLRLSYRVRVCFPSSAVSISLEYFPTPSGSDLVALFALALFMMVDLAW